MMSWPQTGHGPRLARGIRTPLSFVSSSPTVLSVNDLSTSATLFKHESGMVRVATSPTVSLHITSKFGPGYPSKANGFAPSPGATNCDFDKNGKIALEAVRYDMVAGNSPQYWHNRTVYRMVYDHFVHKHELYVGTDHGVDKISPDLWHPSVGWFLSPQNQQQWMSDHLHPRACYHAPCVDDSNQRLGDWRALAFDSAGDLWVGGRWAAGAIKSGVPFTAPSPVSPDSAGPSRPALPPAMPRPLIFPTPCGSLRH